MVCVTIALAPPGFSAPVRGLLVPLPPATLLSRFVGFVVPCGTPFHTLRAVGRDQSAMLFAVPSGAFSLICHFAIGRRAAEAADFPPAAPPSGDAAEFPKPRHGYARRRRQENPDPAGKTGDDGGCSYIVYAFDPLTPGEGRIEIHALRKKRTEPYLSDAPPGPPGDLLGSGNDTDRRGRRLRVAVSRNGPLLFHRGGSAFYIPKFDGPFWVFANGTIRRAEKTVRLTCED